MLPRDHRLLPETPWKRKITEPQVADRPYVAGVAQWRR